MKLKKMFLLFNHKLTPLQEEDARQSLGVGQIIELPSELKSSWGQIPPELDALGEYLQPFKDWLRKEAFLPAYGAAPKDYALIHGDFGAVYEMVAFCHHIRVWPVYSTTRREAQEEVQPDGTIRLVHQFRHVQYRYYNYAGTYE